MTEPSSEGSDRRDTTPRGVISLIAELPLCVALGVIWHRPEVSWAVAIVVVVFRVGPKAVRGLFRE